MSRPAALQQAVIRTGEAAVLFAVGSGIRSATRSEDDILLRREEIARAREIAANEVDPPMYSTSEIVISRGADTVAVPSSLASRVAVELFGHSGSNPSSAFLHHPVLFAREEDRVLRPADELPGSAGRGGLLARGSCERPLLDLPYSARERNAVVELGEELLRDGRVVAALLHSPAIVSAIRAVEADPTISLRGFAERSLAVGIEGPNGALRPDGEVEQGQLSDLFLLAASVGLAARTGMEKVSETLSGLARLFGADPAPSVSINRPRKFERRGNRGGLETRRGAPLSGALGVAGVIIVALYSIIFGKATLLSLFR